MGVGDVAAGRSRFHRVPEQPPEGGVDGGDAHERGSDRLADRDPRPFGGLPRGPPAPPEAVLPVGALAFTARTGAIQGTVTSLTLALPADLAPNTVDSVYAFGLTSDDRQPHWYRLTNLDVNDNASPGARAFYDQHRAAGDTHHRALRALANRLVGILHGCLRHRTTYDEHTAWKHRAALAA